jgi:serine/threonine-protein kinase
MLMLVQHIHQEPSPPSALSELAVPAELDQLVLDCLQKDKTERPPSAELLGARLATVRLVDPWTRDRARQWWERHVPRRSAEAPVPAEEAAPQVVKV